MTEITTIATGYHPSSSAGTIWAYVEVKDGVCLLHAKGVSDPIVIIEGHSVSFEVETSPTPQFVRWMISRCAS